MRNRLAIGWCLALVCAGCGATSDKSSSPSGATVQAPGNRRLLALEGGPVGAPLVQEGSAWVATGLVQSLRVESDGSWSYRATRSTKTGERVDGRPLRLAASQIERGGMRSDGPRVRAGDDARQVAMERGMAVERIDWSERAVEQSWTFRSPPIDTRDPGKATGGILAPADLVVRVPVSGLDFVGESSDGVRFRDPSSQTIVRYGVATFVDAAGERTTLLPRYLGGEIVITVPASVVDGARYPAVLDPQLSPELEIDNPLIVPGNAEPDGVAYDRLHDQYLVVWRNSGVWAQRVTYAGGTSTPVAVGSKILVAALPFGGTGLELTGSSVYFDGTDYQVFWSGDSLSATGLYARRMDSTGAWIEAAVTLDATAVESCAAAVNNLGVGAVTYWKNGTLSPFAMPITNGASAGSALALVIPGPAPGYYPAIGTDGTSFLVVTLSSTHAPHGDMGVFQVNSSVTAFTILPSPTTAGTNPSIAYGAGQWLITWEDESIRGPGMTGLMGTFITGGVQTPFAISPDFPVTGRRPESVFDGESFITAYQLTPGGQVIVQITPGATPPPITAPTTLGAGVAVGGAIASDLHGHVVFGASAPDAGQREAFAGGWSSGVDGAPCLGNGDCDNGHCISNAPSGTGGTCCAVPCAGDSCTVATCSTDGTACIQTPVAAGTCGSFSSCQAHAAGCTVPTDTDGDNLPDTWENSNNGAGQHYVDANCDGTWEPTEPLLPGASSTTPDVYVTYDYMGLGLDDWSCSTATDCTALGGYHRGESCVGGQCVYSSCTTDLDCTDGAHTDCTAPTDCAAGSYCDALTTHKCQRGAWHAGEQCLVNGSVTLSNPDGTPCAGVNCACYHTHDPEAIAPMAIQKVMDSYGTHGINLHVIRGQRQPHSHVVSYRPDSSMDNLCEGASGASVGLGKYAVSVYDLKRLYLPENTDSFMHYGLFAHYVGCDTTSHCNPPGLGGVSDCPYATNPDGTPKNIPAQGQTGLAEVEGNDFVVALGGAVNDSAFVPGIISTAGYSLAGAAFMHELGHNLGLRHDGHVDKPCPDGTGCAVGDVCTNLSDGEGRVCHQVTGGMTGVEQPNDKPNYISLMNYRYEPNGIQNANTLNTAPLDSGPTLGSASADATLNRLDYSSQVLPTGGPTAGALVENNLSNHDGLGAAVDSHFTGQQLLFTYKDGSCSSSWRTAPATGSVDWVTFNMTYSGTGLVADVDAPVGISVCAGSPSDTLSGHSDWDNLVYQFQCASTFEDGFSSIANYPQEPDVPSLSGGTRGQACGEVGCLGPVPPTAANPGCSSGLGCANPIPAKIDIRPGAQNNWVIAGDGAHTSPAASIAYTGGGGGCKKVCGGRDGDHACFANGTSTFHDPTDGTNVVTGVTVSLEGMDCTYGGFLSVYLNGFFVGTTSTKENTCKCGVGHCVDYPQVVYQGDAALPGWVAGGDNTLNVVTSNGNQVCLHAATVTTTSHRFVPVAIYGSALLDVNQIDPASLRFGHAPALGAPAIADLDGDGYADLAVTFADTGVPQDAVTGTVTGSVRLALGGELPLAGSDVVHPVNAPQADVPCSAAGYSGDNGCWYMSALGASCDATCLGHGGFNAQGSTHTGNLIGKGFFPLKASGPSWQSVECSSVDNNTDFGANGSLADGAYSNPACYLSCSCND